MNIINKLANLLELLVVRFPKPPYWVEIKTQNPTCTYYFGHFNHLLAAKLMQQGYIKDLIEEKATVVSVKLRQCNPQQLTITETKEYS
ncbi:MAG: DUF1816 domain-containing protein [Pleurocapsa sp. MO_226.B13]|nr:DUF1816 domain-containing protein [Pleurocapsa sp. MO_226.B13]